MRKKIFLSLAISEPVASQCFCIIGPMPFFSICLCGTNNALHVEVNLHNRTWWPDGIGICIPNIPLWLFLEGFGMEMLVYFTAIWNILRQFGIFYGHWDYFMTSW
jgi:hypothetical protein